MHTDDPNHIIDSLIAMRAEITTISRKLTRIDSAVHDFARSQAGFGGALMALGDDLAAFQVEARQAFIRFHIGMQEVLNAMHHSPKDDRDRAA